MAEPMDDRYATFREHAELRERTATLEATVLQIGPALARIETMVATRPAQPQETAAQLAVHNAADALRQATQKGGNANPLFVSLGTIVALMVGAIAAKFFL